MAIVILVTSPDGKTTELPIFGKITVGRSSSCEYTIDDRQMSGKHGTFEVNVHGQLFFTDLGSTNGSFLNNSQIHKIQFRLNEVLKMGNTLFKIDKSKLNKKEALDLGVGINQENEKTIILHNVSKSIVTKKTDEKKSVILNKDLKKRKPLSNYMGGGKEKVIEQEDSGQTKFLKLDTNKKKKI
jgi:pSer/pThr/pTyr-binding forkhead associated (FHA) protein